MSDLEAWVREGMKRLGLDERALAARSGVHASIISRILSRKRENPSGLTVSRLERVLGQAPFEFDRNQLIDETVDRFSSLKYFSRAEKILMPFTFSHADRRLLQKVWAKLGIEGRTDAFTSLRKLVLKSIPTNSGVPREVARVATYHLFRFLTDRPSLELKHVKEVLLSGSSSLNLVRAGIIGEVQNESTDLSEAMDQISSHIKQVTSRGSKLSEDFSKLHCDEHVAYYGGVQEAVNHLLTQFENRSQREYAPLVAYIPWVLRQLILRNEGLVDRSDEVTQNRLRELLRASDDLAGSFNEIDRLKQTVEASISKYSRTLRQRVLD